MSEILLFHHAQGRTGGVREFAARLAAHGHRVHLPDLYEGVTYDTLEDGVAFIERTGIEVLIERGVAAAAHFPDATVFAGFSLGAMPAQRLAQHRPGARAAVLYHSGVPARFHGGDWPAEVALQVHIAEQDELGELDLAGELVDSAPRGSLHLYPGSGHLFTDSSLPVYEAESTELVLQRTVELLAQN